MAGCLLSLFILWQCTVPHFMFVLDMVLKLPIQYLRRLKFEELLS
jgi:hypothetical protein